MKFSTQKIKEYEETDAIIQAELEKQGIPKLALEKVIEIVDETELTDENRTAFLIVLLAKAFNKGRLYGINEEREKSDITSLYDDLPEDNEEQG